MLIPKEGSCIRVFGIKQENKFNNRSKRMILKNPRILIDKVDKDEKLLLELIFKSRELKNKKNLFKIIKGLSEEHYFLFFLCFSLGLMLFKNKHLVKDKKLARKALKIHDNWRNTLFEKEMKIFDNLSEFLKKLAKKTKIKDIEDFYYLEIGEFEKVLEGNFNNELKKKINRRKKGFAYIFFPNKIKIIEDSKTLIELENWFKEELSSNILRGIVVFKDKNKIKIKGRVKIVKNPRAKIKARRNMILVAIQTTPDFIPIIKNFSGIITDEGGITCHAAIISREFKIPCIVGAKIATKVLKDGDLVEINTITGIVCILK